MFKKFSISFLLLVIFVISDANAQYKFYLPSEKSFVTYISFSDWKVKNRSEYYGDYLYCKNESSDMQTGNATISKNGKNLLLDLNHSYDGNNSDNTLVNLKFNSTNFSSNSHTSGRFRKIVYQVKSGNPKTSYLLVIDGDCCDGACDSFYEKMK